MSLSQADKDALTAVKQLSNNTTAGQFVSHVADRIGVNTGTYPSQNNTENRLENIIAEGLMTEAKYSLNQAGIDYVV